MTDSRARDLVERAHVRHNTYDRVTMELKETYDQCQSVFKAHFSKLTKKQEFPHSQQGLDDLLAKFYEHTAGLKTCGGATYEQVIAALMEQQMAEETHQQWLEHSSKTKKPPTYASMIDFPKGKKTTLPVELKRAPKSHLPAKMNAKPSRHEERRENK